MINVWLNGYTGYVRCLGGENNGEYCHVDIERHRVNDLVKIPEKLKPAKIFSVSEPLPDIAECNYIYYRLACLNLSKDERLLFLVPENWTDRQAIEHQFRK